MTARRWFLALSFALNATESWSQGGKLAAPSDKTWEAWTELSLANTRGAFEQAAAAARKTTSIQRREERRTRYNAVREPALDRETADAGLERLTLAFKTDVGDADNGDVEAGVSVAPAILFGPGPDEPRAIDGLSLIVATLKEAKTRLGAKWAWTSTKVPGSLSDIGLPPCKLDEEELRKDLERLRSHFNEACRVLTTHFSVQPQKDAEVGDWLDAQAACTGQGEVPRTLTQARSSLLNALKNEKPRASADQLQALTLVEPSLSLLDPNANRLPLATTCYTPQVLLGALRQEMWQQTKVSAGLLATVDYFPRKTGFNPDLPKPLPRGENAAWLIQAGVSVEKARYNLTGSFGFARARPEFGEQLYTSFRPTFSASLVVARLDGQALLNKEGTALNFREDGTTPPLLVAGVLAKLDYAKTRPDVQASKWNSIEIQAFLDFRVTEKLSFRVGIPYRGGLVTRKEDATVTPKIEELRKLQWTLPVFVATVIKM